jgi:hypothetical protein
MSPPSRIDFPNRSKDAETDLQFRSRVVQTLNVPQRVRLGSSLAAALLDACLSILPGSASHVLGMKTIEFCNAEIVFLRRLTGLSIN